MQTGNWGRDVPTTDNGTLFAPDSDVVADHDDPYVALATCAELLGCQTLFISVF